MSSFNTLLRTKSDPFSSPAEYTYIENLLREVEDGKHADVVMSKPPIKPVAGSVILYRLKNSSDANFMDDQYFRFDSRGAGPIKRHCRLIKKYYQLSLPLEKSDESEPSCNSGRYYVNFKKHIYSLTSSTCSDRPAVLLHYLGDEKLYKPHPHQNSRVGRIFCRTGDEVRKQIKNEVSDRFSKPKLVYETMVKKGLECNTGNESTTEEILLREPVQTPRDEKQVRNFKEKISSEKKLHQCDIASIYEMAKSDMGKFILKMDLIPNDIIIVAEPSCIELANQLMQISDKDTSLPQLLCYDTTFELADTYVSILVGRNITLHGDPIFPIAFMLHDRKLQEVHEVFWATMKKHVDLKPLQRNIPICTDREKGINNAIRKVLPSVNLIFCGNHIKRDVRYWLQQSSGKTSVDLSLLGSQISALLECDSKADFDTYFEAYKFRWSKPYLDYIEDYVKKDMLNSSRFNVAKFSAFKDLLPTNNLSESMNFMVKHKNDWKELTLDVLTLQFIEMQCAMLLEFSRASRNIGKFRTKKGFDGKSCVKLPSYVTYSEKQFIEMFKKNRDSEESQKKETSKSKSNEILAQKCIQMNLVTLVPSMSIFIVRSPYSEKTYVVNRDQRSGGASKFKCSCNMSRLCYHITAVEMSIGADVTLKTSNLQFSQLKKKSRGHKNRCGRKKPNADDLVDAAKEAPDSLAAKIKRKISTNLITYSDDSDDFLENEPPKKTSKGATKFLLSSSKSIIHRSSPEVGHLEDLLNFQTPESFDSNQLNREEASILECGKWLYGETVDRVMELVLKKKSVQNVLYVNSLLYRAVQSGSTQIIPYSRNAEGLNKDIVFVCVHESLHWMLGIISFRLKTIVLYDSFFHNHENDASPRESSFKTLFKIAAGICFAGNCKTTVSEWKFVYAVDAPIQNDGTECGVIVCLEGFAFLNNLPLPNETTLNQKDRNRRWVFSMFLEWLQLDTEDGKNQPNKNTRSQVAKEAERRLSQLDLSIPLHIFRDAMYQALVQEIFPSDMQWTMCGKTSCTGDADHAKTMSFCVKCRKWFHEECGGLSLVQYYFCILCQDFKMFPEE